MRQWLIAEEDDLVIGQRALYLCKLFALQRLAQIHPADFRADPQGQRPNVDSFVSYLSLPKLLCPTSMLPRPARFGPQWRNSGPGFAMSLRAALNRRTRTRHRQERRDSRGERRRAPSNPHNTRWSVR